MTVARVELAFLHLSPDLPWLAAAAVAVVLSFLAVVAGLLPLAAVPVALTSQTVPRVLVTPAAAEAVRVPIPRLRLAVMAARAWLSCRCQMPTRRPFLAA